MQGRLALLRWQDMLVGLRGQSAICIKKAWRRMLWALRMHWKLSVLSIDWSHWTESLLGIEHRSMPRNQHRQDIRWQWGNQIHKLRRIHRETEKRGIVEIVWFNRYQWPNKFRNWKWLIWATVPRVVILQRYGPWWGWQWSGNLNCSLPDYSRSRFLPLLLRRLHILLQ